MKLSKEKRVKKSEEFEAYRVRRLLEKLIDISMFGFTYVNYQQDTEKLFRKCKILLETLLGITVYTDLILLRGNIKI